MEPLTSRAFWALLSTGADGAGRGEGRRHRRLSPTQPRQEPHGNLNPENSSDPTVGVKLCGFGTGRDTPGLWVTLSLRRLRVALQDFFSFCNKVIALPALFLCAGQSSPGAADAVGSGALGAAAVPVPAGAALVAICARVRIG